MYTLLGIIIAIIVISLIGFLYTKFKSRIDFYITGLDSKFSLSDLNLLWQVSQICELDNPNSLFFSINALTKCMTQINNKAAQEGTDKNPKTQLLISKLFDYRTKLQNANDEKKGLDSTQYLEKGQKLRVILPGKGVFASKILNNGSEMIISVPRQKDMITITAEEWDGKTLSVYIWRKGDARYVFDTVVLGHGLFIGEPSISLRHTTNLIRTQKRKAVRAKCQIPAQLYIIKTEVIDYSAIETQNGYKCQIEDISEAGAMIRIGGKGAANVQIKIQFNIQNMLIIMFGVVRTVEYNEEQNQSLLHFECIHIEQGMKNEVLSYVYNMLPEREKEIYDALKMTDADEKADENQTFDETDTQDQQTNETETVTKDIEDNLNNQENSEEIYLPDIEADNITDSLNNFKKYD